MRRPLTSSRPSARQGAPSRDPAPPPSTPPNGDDISRRHRLSSLPRLAACRHEDVAHDSEGPRCLVSAAGHPPSACRRLCRHRNARLLHLARISRHRNVHLPSRRCRRSAALRPSAIGQAAQRDHALPGTHQVVSDRGRLFRPVESTTGPNRGWLPGGPFHAASQRIANGYVARSRPHRGMPERPNYRVAPGVEPAVLRPLPLILAAGTLIDATPPTPPRSTASPRRRSARPLRRLARLSRLLLLPRAAQRNGGGGPRSGGGGAGPCAGIHAGAP